MVVCFPVFCLGLFFVGGGVYFFIIIIFLWAASIPCAKECLTVNLSVPPQAYPCTNDKECEVGRYCHSPHQATSACMMCRRKKKRCHRDGMCCPGNRCNNGTAAPLGCSAENQSVDITCFYECA